MSNPYKACLETCRDFPKPGVLFWDFTPLHRHPALFRQAITDFRVHFTDASYDVVLAVEAKGFILGAALAYAAEKPLVLVRKPGLTPGEVLAESFEKEYGTGVYELKSGAIKPGDRVLMVYDILAAPGATQATIRLVERAGGTVVGCGYVIELEYLHAREALVGRDLYSLVKVSKKAPL